MEELHKILTSIRNPLSMIALFVLFVEITVSYAMRSDNLTEGQRWCFVVFCISFPVLLLIIFFVLAWCHPEHFYAPSDYSNDESFLKAMKIGKIEDEVNEIVQTTDETDIPESSRMQVTGWVANAERLAINELLKEFNCPMSQQVLSDDNNYLFDAVIHKGSQIICVEVKYIRRRIFSPISKIQIRRFSEAAGCFSKILAIVTPEILSDSIKDKYKSAIDEIDNTIELRFYKL